MALLVTHDIGGNQEGLDGFALVDVPADNGDYYTFDGSNDGLKKTQYGDETTIDIYAKFRIHNKSKSIAQILWKSGGNVNGIAIGLDASGNIGLFGAASSSRTSITIANSLIANDVWYELYANTAKVSLKKVSDGSFVSNTGTATPGNGSGDETIAFGEFSPITGGYGNAEWFDGDIDIVEIWDAGTLSFPTADTEETEDTKLDINLHALGLHSMGTDIHAASWEYAHTVLDLSAYYQSLENAKLDISVQVCALSDFVLDVSLTDGIMLIDTILDLAACFQKIEDAKLDMVAWGYNTQDAKFDGMAAAWVRKDQKTDMFAGVENLESIPMSIISAREISSINAMLDMNITDGVSLQDGLLDIEITDAVLLDDAGLDLAVIEVAPTFRAVYAMHLDSVITEI